MLRTFHFLIHMTLLLEPLVTEFGDSKGDNDLLFA